MLVILAGDGTLFGSPEFWVGVAFLGFMGLLLYYGVPSLVTRALDERAEGIKRELDEARRLRDEARDLLADYQRKAAEAEKDAAQIVSQAQSEALALANETHRSLEEMLERRTRLAEEKIQRAEQQALGEVQAAAVDAAVLTARHIIEKNMTTAIGAKMVDQSIKDLGGKLT